MATPRRSPFVGRARELGALRAGLAAAASGQGRVVLLAGEPGIGKTRTAEEFARRARAQDIEVLVGRCYEGDGAPAFWPWVQGIKAALDKIAASHPELGAHLHATVRRGYFCSYVPDPRHPIAWEL